MQASPPRQNHNLEGFMARSNINVDFEISSEMKRLPKDYGDSHLPGSCRNASRIFIVTRAALRPRFVSRGARKRCESRYRMKAGAYRLKSSLICNQEEGQESVSGGYEKEYGNSEAASTLNLGVGEPWYAHGCR